ncbi:Transposon Ty3-I Gag-Pol polyprotein [Vitis vinifera]|uniref:Transposon Ty3-I Gag-Pol polyprotein n=1 Tax=Vitis vinifera TaxID=29760 RepID=A0A438FQ57_VITVI|nr:Transposon Ty3-I Gag-Pol polyprotein [Vitis vinifera]
MSRTESREDYGQILPSDIKGKKPFVRPRPTDATGTSSSYDQTYTPQTLALPYYASQGIERPSVSYTATGQPCYAAQFTARPAAPYPRPRAQQTSAPFALRTQRQFSQIGMSLSQALRKLTEGPGHETDRIALRHAVQDLIDQGLVHLGQPSVTTNPLPAHTTHAVPPPADDIHFLEFDEIDDHIHMLSDDDSDPEPIMPGVIYEMSGVTLGPRTPAPFRLVPEAASVQAATVEPLILPHYSVRTPFILIPDVKGVAEHSGSYFHLSLLASSSTHRDALIRALSQIRGRDYHLPEGLIHMMTAGRATCIVFSDDDLPPRAQITRVHSTYLLVVQPSSPICPSGQWLGPEHRRAYDSTRREVMGTLEIELLIGPATFVAVFQVLRIPTSFNLLLGRPWIIEPELFLLPFIRKTLEMEDFCRDFVAMSFDQHSSTVVLNIMRSMSYLPGMGLGRRQHGPSEFIAFPNRDILFGSDSFPLKADYRHMARLRKGEGHRAHAPSDGIIGGLSTTQEAELQRLVQQLQLSDGAPGPSTSVLIAPPSRSHEPYDALLPDEIDDHGTFAEGHEIVDLARDQPRELRIGSDLSTDERDSLIQCSDPTWTFSHEVETIAPSLELAGERGDPEAAQCRILISGRVPGVAGQCRPCSQKDGKVRVCVDFRDLNKASPKDDFPLPHIDMLVDSTAGHSMLSFMDGFSGYSQILMAPEDMEKTSFITEWGTYCYRVMPFGLKNAGATYQRAATTLFHDMMHRDVEFRLRLNPKKCTFGVTSGKLLGYMVSERGIEVDPDKIRAILDMPAPRTEREVRGFLGRLQYISRFIARLTDICEPIFRLLRKSQPTVWDDQCQRAFERIREYLLSPPVLAPPTPGRPLLLYLSVSDVAWVHTRSGWSPHEMVGVLLISPHGDHIPRSVRLAFSDRHPATNNIVEYEACILGLETALELGLDRWRFDDLRYTHLPRAQNQFADALATLASMIDIPVDATVRPLLIESRSAPAYCCLIDDVEPDDGLPWYHDIYHFLRLGVYPEAATAKDKRALRQLATDS